MVQVSQSGNVIAPKDAPAFPLWEKVASRSEVG